MAKSVTLNNCTGLNATMEIDKLVTSFTMTGCTWYSLHMQSVAIDLMTLDNTHIIGSITGSARKLVIRNGCNIGGLHPGPAFFGYAHELDVSESVISTFGPGGGALIKGGNSSNNGIHIDYTMASGIITVPAAMRTTGVGSWGIANEKMFLVDTLVGTLGSFTITDVTDTGSDILIHTDWSGGFPVRAYGHQGLFLFRHPAPICTFRNVTGCPEVVDLSGAPAGVPLNSYTRRTYTGSVATGQYGQMWGRFKYLKITVTKPYTGATRTVQATLGNSNNQPIKMSDRSNAAKWNPVVNLKTAGTRIFDATAGTYPVSWTGTQAGDV